MLKDFAKVVLTAKAVLDVLKEKVDLKASELAIQLKEFTEKKNGEPSEPPKSKLKEKAKEELLKLIAEISHRAQINELQIKGYIKDKLTELTNNALLDSMELNEIRSEIARLGYTVEDRTEGPRIKRGTTPSQQN